MGKKKIYRKFIRKNKLLLAALGGATAGIAIASIMGTEKAQRLVEAIEGKINKTDQKAERRLQEILPNFAGA